MTLKLTPFDVDSTQRNGLDFPTDYNGTYVELENRCAQ